MPPTGRPASRRCPPPRQPVIWGCRRLGPARGISGKRRSCSPRGCGRLQLSGPSVMAIYPRVIGTWAPLARAPWRSHRRHPGHGGRLPGTPAQKPLGAPAVTPARLRKGGAASPLGGVTVHSCAGSARASVCFPCTALRAQRGPLGAPTSASGHLGPVFVFVFATGSCRGAQAVYEFAMWPRLASNSHRDPPASASGAQRLQVCASPASSISASEPLLM